MAMGDVRLLGAALGLLCLAGCGGGGGSDSLAAPSAMQAAWGDRTSLQVNLSWVPVENVSAYAVECRFGSQGFVEIDRTGPATTTEQVSLDPASTPEMAEIAFRVRAIRSDQYSPYTDAAAPLRTGPRPPTFQAATVTETGIDLGWTNASAAADTLTLERGVSTTYGAAPTWTPIPDVTFGMTHYLDAHPPENAFLTYRATYAKGSDTASATSPQVTMALRSPSNLTAAADQERVHLAWSNRSSIAAEVVVCRAAGLFNPTYTDIAHLAPDATSFDDLQLPTGAYTYRVEARWPGSYFPTLASSAPVQVVTQPLPVNGVSLTSAVATMPEACGGALSKQGGWYLAQDSGPNPNPFSLFLPSAGGWTSQALTDASGIASPGVILDSHGNPHCVYLRDAVSGGTEKVIQHTWLEGTEWKVDVIARRTFTPGFAPGGSVRFALDAADNPVIVWSTGGDDPSRLECACKVDGAWTVEALPGASTHMTGFSYLELALDASGAPSVALGSYSTTAILTRLSPGQWSTEFLPTGYASFELCGLLFTADGDLHAWGTNPSDGYTIREVRRSGGSWGTPQNLPAQPRSYLSSFQVREDAAHGRLALACQGSQGGLNLLVYGQGAWTSLTLASAGSDTSILLGFDGDGKLQVAQAARVYYGQATGTWLLHTEP